jgi:hypothetical protein
MDEAYDAGFNFAINPSGTMKDSFPAAFGAYISGDPSSENKAALYSAYMAGHCAGTRARWSVGLMTDRERDALDRAHEIQRARGII